MPFRFVNDDLLLLRYLDGTLSSVDRRLLNQRLREDASLRQELRLLAEQAVAFGDLARQQSPGQVGKVQNTGRKLRRYSWVALAASLAVLACSAWLYNLSRPVPVLTLLECSGTVAWTEGGEIALGDRLPAGTLETVGDAASAVFQFADGSLITLHGDSQLSFHEQPQKTLVLSRGTISAHVRPQPPARPMLVRTPSAVAEVVGTSFDLSARSEDTLLKVSEGMVKLKRLVDGSQVEVPANRSAVASLNNTDSLSTASLPEPLADWSFDFATTVPPRDWRGASINGAMQATPYVAKKLDDGRVVTHYGVSVRTSMLERPLRLIATGQSVLRYRLRLREKSNLLLMLITSRIDGGFGGNFECQISKDELRPDVDGWCDLVIPISRCRPVDRREHIRQRHPSAAGNVITSAIINSFDQNHGLEVSRFALSSHP